MTALQHRYFSSSKGHWVLSDCGLSHSLSHFALSFAFQKTSIKPGLPWVLISSHNLLSHLFQADPTHLVIMQE